MTIRRLYRSHQDAQVAGICAGLGHYFQLDPVLIRLIVASVTVFTGVAPGLLTYAAAWVIIPREPLPLPAAPTAPAGEAETPQAPEPTG